jgi:hypothetical protein
MRFDLHARRRGVASASARSIPASGSVGRDGIALVITLIMLAVVTVMAVVFLGISRRERTAVSVSVDMATARLMSDHALARAQAQLVGRIGAESNLFAYDYQVSTNFVNPAGFDPAFGTNLLNVGYTYANGQRLTQDHLRQSLRNLYYDPRPPVFITTNFATGEQDFRFYLDVNRNGRFETNGFVPMVTNRIVVGTNWMVGDPEWVGVLERLEERHSSSNQFVGRYAYIVLPAGKSLDANFIHNSSKTRGFSPPTILEGYMRNQGAGGWEINMAAFFESLMPRMYTPPFVPSTYGYRPYLQNGVLASSDGASFQDALSVLTYRYGNLTRPNIWSVTDLYGARGASAFRFDRIDGYGAGPVLVDPNPDPTMAVNWDNPLWPWWASDSFRGMENIQEWFDETRSSPQFVNRLRTASSLPQNTEYEYTFSRLLGQMGLDSTPANRDKLHLNFVNVDDAGKIVPHLVTNFFEWTPVGFFTNAAAKLFQEHFGDQLRVDYIPVYPTNYYSSAVHRLLQLSANMYDARTNRLQLSDYPYLPSVFRPVFTRFETNGVSTNVVISGFVQVTNDLAFASLPWVSLPEGRFLISDVPTSVNVHGVPWVIGAKKGWPNFNEFHLQTAVTVTRRMEAYKPTATSVPRLNQSYEIGISNLFGVETWNSYTQAFPRELNLYVTNLCTMSLRDELLPLGDQYVVGPRLITNNFVTNIAAGTWEGNEFQLSSQPVQLVPTSEYWPLADPPLRVIDAGIAFDQTSGYPVPDLKLEITNRLVVILLATVADGSRRVVDFVNLDGMVGGMDITANLIGRTNIFADRGVDTGSFWVTNRLGDMPQAVTWGITNQLFVSTNDVLAASDWRSYTENPISGQQKEKAIDDFRLFMGLPALYDTRRTQPPVGPRVQVPFSPSRVLDQALTWQANDPLVHYHLEDLYDAAYANVENVAPRPPGTQPEPSNLGKLNQRYRPWGGRPGSVGDPWAYNPGVKDPLIRRSDDWDFPTNLFPTVGWLGRVHRGTPWQTVYLKSPVEPVDRWMKWSMRAENHPTNDWWYLQLFTTATHDNAARGLLGVNQTNLAAWSAVLSGVAVLSNSAPSANLTTELTEYEPWFVEPNSPQLRQMVESINLARQAMPQRSFVRMGHVLAAPALSVESPYLNRATDQTRFGLNDVFYEWIPQQILGLLKEDEPFVVVYAYGQSLRPADRSIIVTPGPFQGMCTNYQITGEVLTKTALRLEEIRRPNLPSLYRTVTESFAVLPND